MRNIIFIFLIISTDCRSQTLQYKKEYAESGIRFYRDLSWKQIMYKARVEGKYILVDFFSPKSTAYQYLRSNILLNKDVDKYLKEKFICIEAPMGGTNKDSVESVEWFGDSHKIASEFSIVRGPTFMFFNPDGIPIHRILYETYTDPYVFINNVAKTFESEKSYYRFLKNVHYHLKDSSYLRDAISYSLKLYDKKSADTIANYFLNTISNLYDSSNLTMLLKTLVSSSDKAFKILVANPDRMDKILGKDKGEDKLISIVVNNLMDSLFSDNDSIIINWKSIATKLEFNFPSIKDNLLRSAEKTFKDNIAYEIKVAIRGDSINIPDWGEIEKSFKYKLAGYDFREILVDVKMRYYGSKMEWQACGENARILLNKYGSNLTPSSVNNICWFYIFYHINNRRTLNSAIHILRNMTSDTTFSADENIDTYANLLYKIGKRRKAIYWENQAILKYRNRMGEKIDDDAIKSYLIALDKMNKKVPTWDS